MWAGLCSVLKSLPTWVSSGQNDTKDEIYDPVADSL